MEVDAQKEKWWYPDMIEILSDLQRKKVQAWVAQQIVIVIFKTYFYEWDGQIYKQILWGTIWLKATGAEKIKEMEEQYNLLLNLNPIMFEKLTIRMLAKYVYDCFFVLNSLKLGVRWSKENRVMLWSKEQD